MYITLVCGFFNTFSSFEALINLLYQIKMSKKFQNGSPVEQDTMQVIESVLGLAQLLMKFEA